MNFNPKFISSTDDEVPPQYDSEEVKSAVTIQSSYQADPMSTSFYGMLPESTIVSSEQALSEPTTTKSTITRTYVEYTSSPDTGNAETQVKKFTKYLDDADLDFEKTFQQQSAIVTTITSTVQSSNDTDEGTSSRVVTTTTTTTTTVETKDEEGDSKDEKLLENPLGEFKIEILIF